ncbi:MAG: NBR1-Ig-like domain-containing protein [Ignavibacteria bacterium]
MKASTSIKLLLFIFIFNIVSIFSQVDNAKFINQSIPDVMTPGQSYNLIITFENTGSTYWTPGEYRLRINSADQRPMPIWSTSEMDLVKTIEPGNTATFEVKVTAPTTEGVYPFKAELIHGSYSFGESSKPVDISVNTQSGVNSMNSAAFVEQTVPALMDAGRLYKVMVSMTNTGKTTWTTGMYRLVLLDASGSPLTGSNWNTYSVSLDENIAPGSSKVFNFDIMPLQAGTYTLQWRMAAGDAGLFGDATKTSVVTVSQIVEKKNEGKSGKE